MKLLKKCLVPHCKTMKQYARGLCRTHYNIANRLVRRQQTTWRDLERAGKALPSRTGGRLDDTTRAEDWFLDHRKDRKGGAA